MKKYYFKGTDEEINPGDSMTLLIKLKSGKTMQCDTAVDEGTIEDLLKRDSIGVKDVTPVQKKIYRTHVKRVPMPKESDVRVINPDVKEELNGFLNILTGIISGKY